MSVSGPGKRKALVLAGIAAAALLVVPLASERSGAQTAGDARPKSLLPEGFDSGPQEAAPLPLPGVEPAAPPPADAETPLLPGQEQPAVAQAPDPFALPVPTGGDAALSGMLLPDAGGFGLEAFKGSQGKFLAGLARRVDAPIGSRWAAITLRRALLSRSNAPAGIVPGDWVAARALLLMRMGEIDGAKALVDAVQIERYSPALYRVAGQVAMAAADIGGLCPIARTGRLLSADPLWRLAEGMCAALQGDDITAARIFDDLRNASSTVDGFDVRLGERIATIAGGAGRATNIEWSEAPALTPYRFGVATAAGVAVPAGMFPRLGPARFGWMVRNPAVSPELRMAALRPAAVHGSVSAAEIVSGITAMSASDAPQDTPAGRLREAYAGAGPGERLAAIKAIWATPADGLDAEAARYGGMIESALAAERLPRGGYAGADSAEIIAALLSAGLGDAARRWWPVADKAGGAVRGKAWGLLALGAGGVPVNAEEFRDWRSATDADDRRAGLMLAALAGLGLTGDSEWNGLKDELLPRAQTSWTRAISAAAAGRRSGEVAILAATGLQGPWTAVPPLHLYHITAALKRSGRSEEARMIAAEALTRG